MSYSKLSINELLKEINRYDKKLLTIKTQGGMCMRVSKKTSEILELILKTEQEIRQLPMLYVK